MITESKTRIVKQSVFSNLDACVDYLAGLEHIGTNTDKYFDESVVSCKIISFSIIKEAEYEYSIVVLVEETKQEI